MSSVCSLSCLEMLPPPEVLRLSWEVTVLVFEEVKKAIKMPRLHKAASRNDESGVRNLLNAKADANQLYHGRIPLEFAGRRRDDQAARLLAAHKPTLEYQDADGRTMFWLVCSRGQCFAAEALLESGAEVNKSDKRLRTPLMAAAQSGEAEIVRWLLEQGADGKLEDAEGKTARELSTNLRTRQVFELFGLGGSAVPFAEYKTVELDWLVSALPTRIWSGITEMNLSCNAFVAVPGCLAELHHLQKLDLSHNRITHLPFWLGKLPQLERLKARNNPLVGEQRTALNKEIDTGFFSQPVRGALLTYLRTSEQRVPQRHMLLTMLGHFMVGKTALLNSLSGKRPPRPDERTLRVMTDELQDKQSGISFSVRELPGQAQFYGEGLFSHINEVALFAGGNRRFMTLSSAVFVVVVRLTDVGHREEQEELRLWLSLLQHHIRRDPGNGEAQRVRTVLVATHLDQFLARNRNSSKGQLMNDWAKPFGRQLQRDYPAAGLSTEILLLDATDQAKTRQVLMAALRSQAQRLLRNLTVPKWMQDLHNSWQRGHDKRPHWLSYEQALQAVAGLDFQSEQAAAEEKKGSSGRSLAEFALSVLTDMGDVIRLGRDMVICDPSWLSQAIASLVLPADNRFNGIPEGKGTDCMSNGVASAETLCNFLVNRGIVSASPARDKHDSKGERSEDQFQQALALLDWLEALDVLFPLRASAQPVSQLQQLYLVPARLNNARLPAINFEEKAHVVARRLVLSSVERFPPGLIAHLACHLDFKLSPALFSQFELKILSASSQTLVSLNAGHSELTIVIWGPEVALAVDAPIMIEAVKDALSLLRGNRQDGLELVTLCSTCLKTKPFSRVNTVPPSAVDSKTACICAIVSRIGLWILNLSAFPSRFLLHSHYLPQT